MSTEPLLHQFAARIVSLSSAMGLDDEDERLLWEYLAVLPKSDRLAKGADAAKLLAQYGELKPFIVTGWTLTASIDPIFVKPSTGALRRLLDKPLRYTDKSDQRTVCHDRDELIAAITQDVQTSCFRLWFDRLQSVLREDGVNWNPPVSTDIKVEIILKEEPLLPD